MRQSRTSSEATSAATTQSDGVRFCDIGSDPARSTVPAWDGVPIDVDVAFPPEPASGPDGNYPLIMIFHGYGGDKIGLGRRCSTGSTAATPPSR